MEQDKFNELLVSVLKKWEESDAKTILENNEGDLQLNEENQQIFEKICKNIDDTVEKMKELAQYRLNGGTREEWIEERLDEALDAVNATDEQREKAAEIIVDAMENTILGILPEEKEDVKPEVTVAQENHELEIKQESL